MIVNRFPDPYNTPSGLGDFDITSFAGGLSLPVIGIAGFALFLFLFGPGANARKAAIKEETDRHKKAIGEIKRKYRRLPIGSYDGG